MKETRTRPFKLVVQKLGSQRAVAKALGITPMAVSYWTEIPVKHARKIHVLTGIPLSTLRPDVWGGK